MQRNREAVPEAERTKASHTSEDRQSRDTIPMPTSARRPSTVSSGIPVDFPHNSMVGQQILELQFDKFPNQQSFLCWKVKIPKPSDYLF